VKENQALSQKVEGPPIFKKKKKKNEGCTKTKSSARAAIQGRKRDSKMPEQNIQRYWGSSGMAKDRQMRSGANLSK